MRAYAAPCGAQEPFGAKSVGVGVDVGVGVGMGVWCRFWDRV